MLAFECRMVPTVASVGGWWSREHTGLEAASLPTCAALCGSAGSTGHMEHGDCWRDWGPVPVASHLGKAWDRCCALSPITATCRPRAEAALPWRSVGCTWFRWLL